MVPKLVDTGSAGIILTVTRRSQELAAARRAQREHDATKRAARGRLTELRLGEHLETRGVLAGAYRGADLEERSLLTHSVLCEGDRDIRALCSQPVDHVVDSYGYSEEEKAQAPTCPTCLTRWRKLRRGSRDSRIPTEYDGDIPSEYYGTKPKGHTPNARLTPDIVVRGRMPTKQEYDTSLRMLRQVADAPGHVGWSPSQELSEVEHEAWVAIHQAGLVRERNFGNWHASVVTDLGKLYLEQRSPGYTHTPNARQPRYKPPAEITSLVLNDELSATRLAAERNKTLGGKILETWAVHPTGARYEPVAQIQMFKGKDGEWGSWSVMPRDRVYGAALAVARNEAERNKYGHTPNHSSVYYVWLLDYRGVPIDSEGPYGPHTLDSAKPLARIGAERGEHDRVVSIGRDPEADGFEIVRHYRRGTGERMR